MTAYIITASQVNAETIANSMEITSLTGWLDTVQSLRLNKPSEVLTSRMRLRLELTKDLDWLYGLVSVDTELNQKIDGETGIEAHEAWLEHTDTNWDLRIGRQIIIWGKADGIRITDNISPPDYTESITRDLDEIRLPVIAAKLRLLGEYIDTELIWIPVFESAVQATGDNPWAIPSTYPDNIAVMTESADTPSHSLENGEIALKFSAFLSGLDVAASIFYTWDDFPALHRHVWTDGEIIHTTVSPEHHRLTIYGLEFSRPWSNFVFRGETGFFQGKYFITQEITAPPMARNTVKWLGGIDWSPGGDWSIIMQLTGGYILDYDPRLAEEENTLLTTLNISKKLLNQTLTLSCMIYYSINDHESFSQFKAEYELSDSLRILSGLDIFQGDDGQYGVYEDNSQMWVKVKYSF